MFTLCITNDIEVDLCRSMFVCVFIDVRAYLFLFTNHQVWLGSIAEGYTIESKHFTHA